MQLSVDQISALLVGTDLFQGFQPTTLRHVASICRVVELAAGQVLFLVDEDGSSLYVVVDGILQVYRGERIIAQIQPNEYVGEMALFDPGPRSASVRAVTPAQVIEVSRDVYDQFLASEPQTLVAMMRTMTRRLRNMHADTQVAYEHVNLQVHDMLNLVNVLASASLIEDALPKDDENQRFVRMILSVQERLAQMMRVALQRARGASKEYVKAPTDLANLVHECVERDLALHPDLGHVRISIETAPALPACVCNASDVRRVVENLVINASQAAPGGDIKLGLTHDDDIVRLSVRDNGSGIAPETLPRIFEPHFTTKPYGNGLGLASCRQIIETLHGGHLICESQPGRGTTFTCEFPRS